jgi:antitoxin (DNA-binding transcriptional repressor) of toxin-antitoxin stability system
MTEVTVQEAQQRLPELLAAAEAGEMVEIRAESGRGFRLAPLRRRPVATGLPRAGSCRGLIDISADFDAPLDELKEYTE